MYVPCVVESVRVHVLTGQHVVLLQARESERLLPIWIGADQAFSIAQRIAGIQSERPLTHDLMVAMLRKLDVEITRVVVKDLVDDGNGSGVFHGSVFLQSGQRELEIDSRASDAIALAVRVGARILVADDVFDRSSIAPEGSGEDEGELTVFRQFINSLPDDTPPPQEPMPPHSSG
ncbi:MAG: bifunctional nuclease family protein [Chloroflexota bacterium]|nr:bifunctional nuclease family protein [Chloroflexota bacterium]MDE3102113.1 bifunctional nuclease family protein [Chloroflexota bacterium]